MTEYHKIQTVFKRDPETKFKTLLEGEYSEPEFEYLKDNDWVFTEKVDGTNIRVIFDGEKITFRGKSDNAQIPAFLGTALNEMFLPQLDLFKNQFVDGCCLYGEGYGAKIQKGGGNYRSDQSFVLFDVKVGDWWLQSAGVGDVARVFGIDIVPIYTIGPLQDMIDICKKTFPSKWGDFHAEGLVGRPKTELFSRWGKRIITKLKLKDFIRGSLNQL